MIYFDTSALVKRYVKEKGSEKIDSLLVDADSVATSKLTYPEMLSSFYRRWRAGDFSEEWLNKMVKNFEREWENFVIVDVQDDLFVSMKGLIKRHYLKAADTVHLSSALWLEERIRKDLVFVASDLNLLKAAKAEKLETVNPQEE